MEGGINPYSYVINPLDWTDFLGLRSKRGTANPKVKAAVERGKQAHINYQNTLGSGYDFEVTLGNGKRVDAIDWKNKIVRELKPDSKCGIRKGTKQLQGYLDYLNKYHGGGWTKELDLYNLLTLEIWWRIWM